MLKSKPVLTLILSWTLSLLLVAYLGFINFNLSSSKDVSVFLTSLSNWDGKHFISIAQNGYKESLQYAFFPLYPILIHLTTLVTKNYPASALLISFVSFYFALKFFYKLVKIDFGGNVAFSAATYLLVFPTSFFFLTAYSESLYFLLVILTFYFLKKNLFLACIFASLSALTRISGLAVIAALLLYTISQPKKPKSWIIFLTPLGFLIYCFYLLLKTGNPFYFIVAEANWQRFLTIPTAPFWETIRNLFLPGYLNKYFSSILDLFATTFGLGMSLRSVRFLPRHWSIYAILSIIIPLSTGTLSSMPRFLLPIFPIFILMALTSNKYLVFWYQVFATCLLAIFLVLFINNYWVS